MTNITTRIAKALLAVVLSLVGVAGVATAANATTFAPATTAVTAPAASFGAACGDTSGFQTVPLSSLPSQATDTVNLILAGGPFPYPEDGQTFQNREGILPDCSLGYYQEYTVITPGSSTRGTRRIITGQGGEYFYTDDHYASFVLVDINS